MRSNRKLLFIEHIDDELISILQECEKSDIQIMALAISLYWKGADIIELNLQHNAIMRVDRELRKRLQHWIGKHAKNIKEDIDWGAFQTPYQANRGRLKFLLRIRAMQFDATIPGGLQRMRTLAKLTPKNRHKLS